MKPALPLEVDPASERHLRAEMDKAATAPLFRTEAEVAATTAQVLEALNGFPLSQALHVLTDLGPRLLLASHVADTTSERFQRTRGAVGH